MTWMNSLDVSLSEAREQFPQNVTIASIEHSQRNYLISLECLDDMNRMGLGHLPLSAVALPYEMSSILTQPHEENLIRDVSRHLSDYFTNFFVAAIYELQSLFASQQKEAFIIGGITRDMLLSSERRFEIQDVDIIVEGNALDAAAFVSQSSRNFDLVQTFAPFGTAKLSYKNQIEIDFASTRREVYRACGALPEIVEMGVPLDQDIIRRDFTINALALSIVNPGEVIDCSGGLKDLENRKVRLLKAASFFEDPTRIMRALRYATRFDLTLAEDTSYLLDRFLEWMPQVYKGGGDRIRAEICEFFCLPETPVKTKWMNFWVEKGLHRLMDTRLPDVLDLPLPDVLDLPLPVERIAERLSVMRERLEGIWTDDLTWEVYITAIMLGLPEKAIEGAAFRIGLTRHEMDVVEKSLRLLRENVVCTLTPQEKVTRIYDIFHSMPAGAACVGILLSPQYEAPLEAFIRYRRELEPVRLEVSGDDIIKLGVPQGEQIGKLLKALLYVKLQGKVHHRLEEISWLKANIANLLEESAS